jgi:hypothetical protein
VLNALGLWEATANPNPQFLSQTGGPADGADAYLSRGCLTHRRKVREKGDKKPCSFVGQ